MLDPTAAPDIHNYTKEDIQWLCIRRFKKDIQSEVCGGFKERRVIRFSVRRRRQKNAAYAVFSDMKPKMYGNR